MLRITENEMILEWLKGELNSPRFSDKLVLKMKEISVDETIINSPNLFDKIENDFRKKLLDFRGYSSKAEMFEGFPNDIEWSCDIVDKNDFLNDILYINYSYWLELSNGTRKPKIAAENIRIQKEIFGVSNNSFLEIAENVRQGKFFPKLIIVRDDTKSIVLEGHARLTGFALASKELPNSLEIITGYSKELAKWCLY